MIVVSFFIVLLILLVLPFLPGIIEIRRKLDAQPLQVAQNYDVDIHHFASTFRSYIDEHFFQDLNDSGTQPASKQGDLEDGSKYCLLDSQAKVTFTEAELGRQVTNKMFIASKDLDLPGDMTFLNELYASGSITGSDESIYRAMLAGSDITLGRNSILLRWMHAAGKIYVAPGCVLHGRVSADETIQLACKSHFERLNAENIIFGERPAVAPVAGDRVDLKPEDLSAHVKASAGRWLIEHNVEIPANSRINANLVVVGKLTIGENCEINGSIKSHKTMLIKAGCKINGSAVCMENINIEAYTDLKGPLVSEATIEIATDCAIGTKDPATTITAENIDIHANCIAHGTVWARKAGKVL